MAAKSESLETSTYTSASSRLASKIMYEARFTSDPFSSVFSDPHPDHLSVFVEGNRHGRQKAPIVAELALVNGHLRVGLKRANVGLLPDGRLRVSAEERLNQSGEISDALDVMGGKKFRGQRLQVKPLGVRMVLELLPVQVEPVDVDVRLRPV